MRAWIWVDFLGPALASVVVVPPWWQRWFLRRRYKHYTARRTRQGIWIDDWTERPVISRRVLAILDSGARAIERIARAPTSPEDATVN